MRSFAIALLMGFAMLGSAAAQDDSEVGDDERARELFRLGDEYYSSGRYEDALAAFEESYSLSGRPLLLFNMANAQERMGRYDDAIQSLEAYLPDAREDERARVEARLESLRTRAERVRSLADGEGEGGEEPEPESEPLRPLPIALVAGGGALVVGGVVSAIIAGSARSDLDDACATVDGRRLCDGSAASADDRDRRASIAADLLLIAGAGTAVAGVLLWVLGGDDDEDGDDVSVETVALPGGAYMGYRRAF
ncbi:MAG: tetratricopeptide repeat protein [Myxococcota bacterium]